MIVPMRKAYVVARRDDQESLLETLRDLGVVHVTPIDPSTAVAEDQTLAAIGQYDRAVQILSSIEAKGVVPEISPADAAAEAVDIDRTSAEARSRLATLGRQMDQLAIWGDVTLADLAELSEGGIELELLSVPAADVRGVQGELVQTIAELPGKRVLLGVIGRDKEAELPEQTEPLDLPRQDRPAIRAEAAEIDAKLERDTERLAQLALRVEAIAAERAELARQAEFTVARRSGLADEALFAIQGWVPATRAETLGADLAAAGIEAAVEHDEPAEEDLPPTLIEYPRWAKPIEALFSVLGTLPGYREIDLAPFFMVALPLFAAMLIGDAGYGLIFMLPGLLKYRAMVAKVGKQGTHLLLVMGAVTLVWGILSANYFGVTPDKFEAAGMVGLAGFLKTVGPLWNADPVAGRNLIIKISFIFGCIHLTLAHVRALVEYWPDQRAIAEAGWCIVLWAMLGVIWMLFPFGGAPVPAAVILVALGVGLVMAILFTAPSPNVAKRIGIGLASSILPLLGTFSDTMSYIRLMAVGLASYYIAAAFNDLGASLAGVATWAAGALVVLFGHSLNIGLAVIAIFAHGVRLNMLEFSGNAGVQWAGQKYEPFARTESQ